MKKILFLATFVFAMTFSLHAQKDQTVFGCNGIGITGIWGGYNTGVSTLGESFDVNRSGFFTFEIGKTVLLGWERLHGTYTNVSPEPYNMISNGFTFAYSPIAHKAVHPVFGLYAGNGRMEVDEETVLDNNMRIIQPSVDLEMNIFRWFKLGATVGYRFAVNTDIDSLTDEDLSGPYAGVKLKFGWSWGR